MPLDAVLRAQAYAEAPRLLSRARFRRRRGKVRRAPPTIRRRRGLLERARQLAQNPPGPDWEPVNTQDEK